MKNGQTTMPGGQITDGQTELRSKCQGLEEAVAELDNIIRKDCKIVRFGQCEPLSGHTCREAQALSYKNVCFCFLYLLYMMELGGLGLLYEAWKRGASLEN